jgi:hypothetical protein
MEQIRINVKQVKELLESGITKEGVKEQLYPTLAEATWKRALKEMGLSQFRVKVKSYILEGMDEVNETVTPGGNTYAPDTQMKEEPTDTQEDTPFNV